MIDGYNKITLYDKNGKNDLSIEVNWNDSEEVKDCFALRLTLGDKQAIINRDDFFSLLMVLGDNKMQDKLIPSRSLKITKYYKQHRVMAKNDIRKGQQVIINCETDVPSLVREGYKFDLVKDSKS